MFCNVLSFDVMEFYVGKTFDFFEEYLYPFFDFEDKLHDYTWFEEHTTWKGFHGTFGEVHINGKLYFDRDEKTIIGINIETKHNQRYYDWDCHCDKYKAEYNFFCYGTEHYYDEY